jgi:site-specific recombinase XerD
VGLAIQDYILNGRQETKSEALFLRHHAPFQGFANGVAIGDIYDYYRQRAGLPRNAYDGKGFHALRRSLGKSLVTNGIPITMVAQILGDDDIESTKKYISLDSVHLKECALNFIGIFPDGGMYCE